jgi:hypothetical protein
MPYSVGFETGPLGVEKILLIGTEKLPTIYAEENWSAVVSASLTKPLGRRTTGAIMTPAGG